MKTNITVNKVLAVLLASFSLAGCGKSNPGPGMQDVIRFTDYIHEDTKAYSDNTIADIRTNGFNVACVTGTSKITVFNDRAVWENSMSAYVPQSGMFYYPANESVSFFAVYPVTQSVQVTSGSAFLSYTSDPDTDLLSAVKTGVTARKTSVALEFEHILSLVKFKAEGTDDRALYKLKKITVESPDGGLYEYPEGNWTPSGTNTTAAAYEGELTLDGKTEVPGGLTVVPCNPVIHVEWDTYSLDGTVRMASYSESSSLADVLQAGMQNTVTLKLTNSSGNPISFEVTVSGWENYNREVIFQ